MKFGTRHHGSPSPEYDCTTLVFRTKIGLSHEKSIINYLYISFINNYSFAPPGEISTQFKNNKLLKIIILIQILISLLVNFISFSLYESFTNLI